jgi:Mrp family chromosome partitioning ATPase
MGSGPLPPNAADLLGTARFVSLLTVGLEVFDLIVVDGPPVMGLADAPMLANATSASLFVVGASQARMAQIRGALKRLQLARSPILCTVLNKFDAKASGYGYGYGYGYGDGHSYEEYRAPEVNGARSLNGANSHHPELPGSRMDA